MLHDHAAFAGKAGPAHMSLTPSDGSCPVERLGREMRVLHEIQNDCCGLKLGVVLNEVMDRSFSLSEQASHLQAKSLYGALFQVAVANGKIDDITERAVRLAEDKAPTEEKRREAKRHIEEAQRAANRSLWSAAVLLLSHCGQDEVDANPFFLGGLTDFREVVAERLAGSGSANFRDLHAQRREMSTPDQFQMEADALAATRRSARQPFLQAAE